MEISRFPCKRLLRMPGSTTTRGRHVSCDIDTRRIAFCGTENISTPNLSYAAQYLACALPCERFTSALADNPCITRGQCGSLLLHRDGLPPSTFCRSPGAPVHSIKDRYGLKAAFDYLVGEKLSRSGVRASRLRARAAAFRLRGQADVHCRGNRGAAEADRARTERKRCRYPRRGRPSPREPCSEGETRSAIHHGQGTFNRSSSWHVVIDSSSRTFRETTIQRPSRFPSAMLLAIRVAQLLPKQLRTSVCSTEASSSFIHRLTRN